MAQPAQFAAARANAQRFDVVAGSMDRLMRAWLAQADPRTLLLPDRLPGGRHGLKPGDTSRLYTPHNSGADLYPYLILTAHLTDPALYHGRMMEMLRNEVRYTTVEESIPGNLEMSTGKLGPPSLFGAGEYAKDGLLAVTEYLGRTPWFYRMVDMTADALNRAPVKSRFGMLPASDAELNGDYLQTLARLMTMTGDARFAEWAHRIGDAYIEEVLPGNHGVPSSKWDFEAHTGDGRLRLRDHGNETVVGLTLLYVIDAANRQPHAERYGPVIRRMLDRVLASANPDGMLYNEVNAETLKPVNQGLSDNWGYVYGAVYTFYQATGESKYRDAVRRVLGNWLHNCDPRPSCIRSGISCAPCREVPWRRPSLEHSSEAAVRGFSAFFSAGAILAAGAAGAGVAGAVACANAEPIRSRDANTVAVAREDRVIMGGTSVATIAQRRVAIMNRG